MTGNAHACMHLSVLGVTDYMHAHASLPTQSCNLSMLIQTCTCSESCKVNNYSMQAIITYLISDDKIDDKRCHKQN